MINKPFDKIELIDFEQLRSNAVLEGKTIEYKQQFPSNSDADKKEFLADISSFANASGGDFIIGIEEENGSPKSIDGVEIEDIDAEKRKYENIIRDGIEPRIYFEIRVIKTPNNKFIFIIRVNKSWNSPHRVIYKGHDKFYSRNSTGKYPLDTSELRIAFNLSQTLAEQIKKFKTDRITQLIANELQIPFYDGGKIILHLIPLESFNPGFNVDINLAISDPTKLRPIYNSGHNNRFNFEGFLTFSMGSDNKCHSYVQLYRNGIIEAVEGSILSGNDKIIPSLSYEKEILKSLSIYLELLKILGVNVPIIVFLTLRWN